jgi:3-deoxy-D-arabino-heptulosonate 7-phosphate (DAHP) synthase
MPDFGGFYHESALNTSLALSNNLLIGGNDILLMMGLCSVESYGQTYAAAKSMHALGLRVLRA